MKRSNRSKQNITDDDTSLSMVQPVGMKRLDDTELDEVQFKALHKDSNGYIELREAIM